MGRNIVLDNVYWTRVLKKITYILMSVIGIYLAFKLAIFYMPFLIAFTISLIIEPAIRFIMKKTNFTRKASSIIIFVIVFGIIAGLLIWGITTLVFEATDLLQMVNLYFDKASSQIQNLISRFNFDKIQFSTQLSSFIENGAEEFLGNASNWTKDALTKIIELVTSIPAMAIYFAITILALYFICTDKIYILDQAEHHLPKSWIKKINVHLKDIVKTLGGYLKAEAILIIVSFVISLIGLYIYKFVGFNVQYPLIIALAIAFVDALPILGSGTVMIPWGIILGLNGDLKFGIAIIGLWVFMSVVRQFIEPRIVSSNIGIHPIFTLIAMYTGFKFIGVLGLIVGPIILIILKNVFATVIDKGVVKTILDE
jgi:sporulation integral membrane protein YtvI